MSASETEPIHTQTLSGYHARQLLNDADVSDRALQQYDQLAGDGTTSTLAVHRTHDGTYRFELEVAADEPFGDTFLEEVGPQTFSGDLPYDINKLDQQFYEPR